MADVVTDMDARANGQRSLSRSPSRSRTRSPSRSPSPQRDRGRSQSRSRSRSYTRSRTHSRSRSRSPSVPLSAKIVIEKLTKNVNEAHLREIFSSYGEIEDLEMPMNKQFMMNKGIAYILYSDAKYAEEAIACMHEAQLDGACINAGWTAAEERHEEPSATLQTEELFAIQKSATKEEKKPSLQQQGSEREQVPTAKEEVR